MPTSLLATFWQQHELAEASSLCQQRPHKWQWLAFFCQQHHVTEASSFCQQHHVTETSSFCQQHHETSSLSQQHHLTETSSFCQQHHLTEASSFCQQHHLTETSSFCALTTQAYNCIKYNIHVTSSTIYSHMCRLNFGGYSYLFFCLFGIVGDNLDHSFNVCVSSSLLRTTA